jgi:hypothetical protein
MDLQFQEYRPRKLVNVHPICSLGKRSLENGAAKRKRRRRFYEPELKNIVRSFDYAE